MKLDKIRHNMSGLKISKKNIVTFSAVALLVIVGSLLYSFRYDIIFLSGETEKPVSIYSMDLTKQNTVYPYRDRLLIVNNESVICIDKSGREVFDITVKTGSPIVRTAGDYILVADKGGREVYVIHNGEIRNNFSADAEIVNGSITEKGRTVLITNETGYRNVITAYNSRGAELYKWKISEYYINDAVMSYDGSRIAAAYISTDNETLTGGIITVNVRQKKVLGRLAYENEVFPFVAYNGDNSVVAIGDTVMVGVEKTGKEKWKVDYEGKALQTFAFRTNGGVTLSFESNTNNSLLVAYDKNGRLRGKKDLSFRVNNLDMRSGLTLATGSSEASCIDRKCREKMHIDFGQDFKNGWLKENKSMIYLVNGSNIEALKL